MKSRRWRQFGPHRDQQVEKPDPAGTAHGVSAHGDQHNQRCGIGAIVAWTVHVLVSAERPETHWYHGGAKALPIVAPDLGLDQGWQARVIAAVGHYGQIYDRNLGKASPLKLPRGLNANQLGGGLMLSPFLE